MNGVCNACRVRYDRETLFVTQPHEEPEENQAMDNRELLQRLFTSGGIDPQMGRKFHLRRSPLSRRLTRATT